jgi:hypothetical protein
MKTFREFLQQLNEEPMLDTWTPGTKKYIPAKTSGKERHLGKIGPYTITHSKHEYLSRVHIMHNGESVGHIPYTKHKKQLMMLGTSLHPDHRGKKALVKGLMAKTYMMLADKTGHTIRSDSVQTKGGRSIWRQLAKKKRVKFASSVAGKTSKLQRYDPKKHEKLVYGRSAGDKHYLYLHPRKTTAKA